MVSTSDSFYYLYLMVGNLDMIQPMSLKNGTYQPALNGKYFLHVGDSISECNETLNLVVVRNAE